MRYMRLQTDVEVSTVYMICRTRCCSRMKIVKTSYKSDSKTSSYSHPCSVAWPCNTTGSRGNSDYNTHSMWSSSVLYTIRMDWCHLTSNPPLKVLQFTWFASAHLQQRIKQHSCRIESIVSTLSDNIAASNGVEILDKLRFFVRDHPAKQFERGTQQGGTYKCGGCGVRESMMDDLAHTLQWRS